MGQGPLGMDTNQPIIDEGTNPRSQNLSPAQKAGSNEFGSISNVPLSPIEAEWIRTKNWFGEIDDALGMFAWWALGSPSMGAPHGGDLVYGPGDAATEHIKNTAAYQEGIQIYKEWLNAGQPPGRFENSVGTESEYVSDKGYFYVKGRAAGGRDAGPRGDWTQVLKHPLWAYTGQFAIRFTDTGYPKEGYVSIEIENYSSLPSYLHGVGSGSLKVAFLEKLHTKRSGIPFVSRSRQVYRFLVYIPMDFKPMKAGNESAEVTYKVVPGDSLSSIAKAQYGDVDLWPIIYDRNQQTIGFNSDKIEVGQSLLLPLKGKLTGEQIKRAKQTARLRRSGTIPAPPLR